MEKSIECCIVNIYEQVYGSFCGNLDYQLTITSQNSKYLQSFTSSVSKLYSGSIDEDFIFQFIVYQFRYYEDKKTRLGKGKVYLNWILGNKAIERWKNKSENWLFFNEQFIKKYNLHLPIKNFIEDGEKRLYYKKSERKRFFNTELGLIHCSELELFDKYSRECVVCRFKNICNI